MTDEAIQGLRGESVTFIDARSRLRFALEHAPGAIRLSWLTFRNGVGRTGALASDLPGIVTQLVERGVRHDRPLLVYGDALHGWGEDGRIVWMLRYLGFRYASLIDGGWQALRSSPKLAELAVSKSDTSTPGIGPPSLTPTAAHSLRATAGDVQRVVDDTRGDPSRPLLIDTRSLAEWEGSRRYWPARTGRIPGAVHVHWRDLLDREGRLDRTRAFSRLADIGAHPTRHIITYCVGGVRSAHMLVMLRALGFPNVRNYDGSWYEWSADPTRPIIEP